MPRHMGMVLLGFKIKGHDYRYVPPDAMATRMFLAGTRKILGFNLEAWVGI